MALYVDFLKFTKSDLGRLGLEKKVTVAGRVGGVFVLALNNFLSRPQKVTKELESQKKKIPPFHPLLRPIESE